MECHESNDLRYKADTNVVSILIELASTLGANKTILLQCAHLRDDELNEKHAQQQFPTLYKAAKFITQEPQFERLLAQRIANETLDPILIEALTNIHCPHKTLSILTRHFQSQFPNINLSLQGTNHFRLHIKPRTRLNHGSDELEYIVCIFGVIAALTHQGEGVQITFELYRPAKKLKPEDLLCRIFGGEVTVSEGSTRLIADHKQAYNASKGTTVSDTDHEAHRLFFNSLSSTSSLPYQPPSDLLKRLIKLLLTLTQPAHLDACAKQLSLHPRQLRRQLHASGHSFRQLSQDLMVLRAQRYLSHPSLTVDDVACCLGYENTANFRRSYMKQQSISPAQFKKSLKTNP